MGHTLEAERRQVHNVRTDEMAGGYVRLKKCRVTDMWVGHVEQHVDFDQVEDSVEYVGWNPSRVKEKARAKATASRGARACTEEPRQRKDQMRTGWKP